MEKNTQIAVLAIVLLFLVIQLQHPGTFILYGGVEIPANETNVTGECWTLGQDACVRRPVKLINFTKQSLLVCPEGYYPTKEQCEKAYSVVKTELPKIKCYYINEDACWEDELTVEQCPSLYYSSKAACEEALETPIRHIKKLFQNKITLIILAVAVIAGVFLFFGKRRK